MAAIALAAGSGEVADWAIAWSASHSASVSAQRSAGSLRRHRAIRDASGAGTSGRRRSMASGSRTA
jgi:hypothetical protein